MFTVSMLDFWDRLLHMMLSWTHEIWPKIPLNKMGICGMGLLNPGVSMRSQGPGDFYTIKPSIYVCCFPEYNKYGMIIKNHWYIYTHYSYIYIYCDKNKTVLRTVTGIRLESIYIYNLLCILIYKYTPGSTELGRFSRNLWSHRSDNWTMFR